jgi:archaemetzincin
MKKGLCLSILFLLLINLGCDTSIQSKTIGVQPYIGIDKQLIAEVKEALEDVYSMKVIILEEVELPKTAYVNIKSPRYRADSLLRHLKRVKPDSIDFVLGLTAKDISTTKKDASGKIKSPKSKYQDWGIMGLGYRPGPSCVVSTYRIKIPNKKLFLERLKKVSVHEIGHNLGLKHCETDFCVMRDAAETVKTIDKVELRLCDSCLEYIN